MYIVPLYATLHFTALRFNSLQMTDKPLIIQTRPNLTQTQSCPKPKYAPKTKADHVSEIFAALQYFGQTTLRQVLCTKYLAQST